MSSNKSLPMESVASVALAAERPKAVAAWNSLASLRRKDAIPTMRSSGKCARLRLPTKKGRSSFRQDGVEIPKGWSQTATNIVVSKYFHGQIGTPQRERSVRQLVERVVRTMTEWGVQGGYFASAADASTFHDELAFLLLNQYAAFNSPVWFNCGIEPNPQCSACFINSVEDTMDSILPLSRYRGEAFQVRFGHRHQFFVSALLAGEAFGRRDRFRAGQLHERV